MKSTEASRIAFEDLDAMSEAAFADDAESVVNGRDLGAAPRIEEVLRPENLAELCASFRASSGVDVRMFAVDGRCLVESDPAQPWRLALADAPGGEDVLATEEAAAATAEAGDDVADHSGQGALSYLVANITYDHDVLGRVVMGPFVLEGSQRPSGTGLRPSNPGEGPAAVDRAAEATPRLSAARARAQLQHLRVSLDLILHAGQRARLASTMHLASMQESYRELLGKNAELSEAYDRLKELDRLKSAFLATVSHELRTPLTSIIGYSEMLAEGMCGDLTKDQLEFVQTIRQKGDQLLSLIMSLLDLSKLESGTLRMHASQMSVESILGDAISTVTPAAAKKGVKLELANLPATPALRADPDRLRQVFVNLVDNAVKFTPRGGVVRLEAREIEAPMEDLAGLVLMSPVRREVEVRVCDSGIGIPEHERARVFDPFYQVDQSSTREAGGAGLGLSIVKRIVEAHQGRIRIEGNEPQGAVFVVSLPVATRGSIPPAGGSVPPPASRRA